MERLPKATKDVLQAYEDVFTSPSGEVVLEDLRASFFDKTAEERYDLEDVPAEMRAWVIDGQRRVIRAVERAVELNGQTISEDNEQ